MSQRVDVSRSGEWMWSVWSVAATFGVYFCMYGLRKPFTAASYDGLTLAGLDYKTIVVAAQVLGYALSKFIGIKVISELQPQHRILGLILVIAATQSTLLLFGLIPFPYNFIAMFLNGLPLGMLFGLLIGYLEGRQTTEALTAGLCASFVLADGVTKSVGAGLLSAGVPQQWMPCVAGLIFLAPLAVFVWMLTRIPPPSETDILERSERVPISRAERWSFFASHAPGLVLLLTVFLMITIVRSVRADFAPEIWRGLGRTAPSSVFAVSESIIALAVLTVNGLAALIRDNRRAFFTSLGICLAGFGVMALALIGLHSALLDPFLFMLFIGLGVYLPYVAIHTTVFERLIAMTRGRATVGFLLYLADAPSYLGYVAVMLCRSTLSRSTELAESGALSQFFIVACWIMVSLSTVCLSFCWRYFAIPSRSAASK